MTEIIAVTTMRNEAPYIVEWVAHHLAAGVTRFVVFTHDCEDGTDRILSDIPQVIHVPFERSPGKSVQWQAMALADRHPLVKSADWVIFFDCDEFLCLHPDLSSFDDLINRAPAGTEAIALRWHLFGAGKAAQWQEGLTTQRFRHSAGPDIALPAAHFFKTLFRPKSFQKLGVHRPKRKRDSAPLWSLGGGAALPRQFSESDQRINLFGFPGDAEPARLNHYSLRSAQEFMIKCQRGLPNRQGKRLDLGYWAERNFNTVEDFEIDHMLPATLAEYDRLMSIPEVADGHRTGVKWHRDQFAKLMLDVDQVRFYWHLQLLGGSHPPDKRDVIAHAARLEQAKHHE